MSEDENKKTIIWLTKKTVNKLKRLAESKDDTYEDIILRLMETRGRKPKTVKSLEVKSGEVS
jgi:hypothetical protein